MSSEKYKQVLNKVHLSENRVVADMLYNSGLQYRTIFGANIVHLREIAKAFAPDHELATELWEKDIREMKILSLLIDDPAKITPGQMDKQVSEFNNPELIEQACYSTFPKVSFAMEKALSYCQHDNHYIKATGYTLAAKVAQLKQFDNEGVFDPILETISENSKAASIYLRRSIATALRLIARINDETQSKCKSIAEDLNKQNDEASKWIAEEVLFELNL